MPVLLFILNMIPVHIIKIEHLLISNLIITICTCTPFNYKSQQILTRNIDKNRNLPYI